MCFVPIYRTAMSNAKRLSFFFHWECLAARTRTHMFSAIRYGVSIRADYAPKLRSRIFPTHHRLALTPNPAVTESQAFDPAFSANFVANLLANNMSRLATKYPNLTNTQLIQATAASYNSAPKT